MKNKMLWIGSVIILILSVICFVVFGVGTELIRALTGEGNGISFGKYNGKDIVLAPGTDFANAVQNYTNYYQRQGQELDQSAYFYIYSYAFNNAVLSAAYKDAVKKSGYKPSGAEISRTMLPYFLNADGKYDPKLYAQVSNADKESLKSDITKQLVWQRFNDDYFGSSKKLGEYEFFGLKTSENESKFLASLNEEKRSFNTVSFSKADYPEDEVKKFGSENLDLFTTYSLSVITVKDESQAKKLSAQLTNNEITFEDAVSEYSEKYYSDGDGKIKENFAYQIKEDLGNEDDFAKLAALSKDSLSDVIKTNNGYSIFKCTGDVTKANIEDKKILDAVKSYINANKQDLVEDYFMEKAKAFVGKARLNGFEEAAKEAGITTEAIEAFPLNYGNVSIAGSLKADTAKAYANASTNEDFLAKAFSMNVNDISDPMVMSNYITVFQLKEVLKEPSNDEALSKIKSETLDYDQSGAQSVLLSSPKVENNVADVYFNKFLSK